MRKRTILVLIAVIAITVWLAACHPHRWHPGCDGYAPAATDAVEVGVGKWMPDLQ